MAAAQPEQATQLLQTHGQSEQQGQQQQQQQQQRPQHPGMSLRDLYLQVRDKPCHVADVRVEAIGPMVDEGPGSKPAGSKSLRLKQEILDRELDRIYEAKTLKEVHEAVERAVEVLRQLEVYDDISALIHSEPQDEPDACTVQLELQETGRYKFGAGTYTQGGEYSFEGHAVARNALGIADQWMLKGEVGTRNSKNFTASFRLPRAGGHPITPEVRVAQAFNNQQLHSSWTEALRGVDVSVRSSEKAGVSLGFEYGWRSLMAGPQASRSVRMQAGDYLKAALHCSYTLEGGGRNSLEVLPTEGWQLRLDSEIGGLAPGAESLRYVRQQARASWAALLAEGLSFHVEGGAGLLLPWGQDFASNKAPVPERFYLGGVETNLRGFDTRGIGASEPRQQRRRTSSSGGSAAAAADIAAAAAGGDARTQDALGGDLFANTYAALLLRLPGRIGDLGVHGQVFANGGNTILLHGGGATPAAAAGAAAAAGPSDTGSSGAAATGGGSLGGLPNALKAGVKQLGQTFRWSAGVGLVFPTTLGRLEANYCWILTSHEHDRVKRGFSFGFAANIRM